MRQPHPVALFSLAVLLFEHCASVTLTRITQQRSNAPRPIASVLVLLTEALKLLMSVCLELTDCGGLGSASTLARLRDALCRSPPDTLRLSVPAVLYTFQNLAIYFALGHLEVIIFQVLYQTKLLLTAVLSVLLLGRRLTFRQWAALIVLTIGVVTVEISDGSGGARPVAQVAQVARHGERGVLGDAAGARAHEAPPERLHHVRDQHRPSRGPLRTEVRTSGQVHTGAGPAGGARHRLLSLKDEDRSDGQHPDGVHGRDLGSRGDGIPSPAIAEARPSRHASLGVLAAVLAASLSSLAGVYFEAIVKKAEAAAPSLWVRNVQLCIFTLPIAAATVGWQWSVVRAQGLVLDAPTVTLVVLNAAGGLVVAAVIKYGDNLLKNFATSCSVIFGTLISVALFDFQLTMSFVWGSLLVIGSAYVYVTSPEPEAPPVAPKEVEEIGTPLMTNGKPNTPPR